MEKQNTQYLVAIVGIIIIVALVLFVSGNFKTTSLDYTGEVIKIKPVTVKLIDTDADGLADAKEKTLGTDPSDADTDGDGLTDGQEVNTYDTNPLSVDTDDDGFYDHAEILAGTDPNSSDTDGDGYDDEAEINVGSDPLDSMSTPDAGIDTDRDGITDYQEYISAGGDGDTDGDGATDYQEDMVGTDPTDPESIPECIDEVDNDADATTDFPYDYGCSSEGDNTEY